MAAKMPKTIQCESCGTLVSERGPNQRYCESCSERRDLERKKLWARNHPLPADVVAEKIKAITEAKELARECGTDTNAQHKKSILWGCDEIPEFAWTVRFRVPFSYAASKNHLYTSRRNGHVALRRESKAIRDRITAEVVESLRNREVVHNKIWLEILVQKPNHRGDAVNVIDLVCDAVKRGAPVDDRWYCISRVDWQIVKDDPCINIGISQEVGAENAQVCSFCGLIKPWADFGSKKDSLHGVDRVCRECRAAGRKLARERRAKQVIQQSPEQ